MRKSKQFTIVLPGVPFCPMENAIVYACLIGVIEGLVKTFL